MNVLLATDADWLVTEVVAALGGPDTSFTVCTEGREVARVVAEKVAAGEAFDVGIFDLQIGSMGGMAVTMSLRLDASSGRLPRVTVLMLLDRVADVHLAKRSGADGWLVKPLDPLRLRRAVRAVVAGEPYREGLVDHGSEVQPSTVGAPGGDVEAEPVASASADAATADVVPAPSH